MAETKRVSDQYKISAPAIVLDGNLTVMGSTTSVETINSTVKDNTIVLNNGETGAGVTAGSAGLEVSRGSLSSTTFLFDETTDTWQVKIGGSYAIVRGATPVDTNDLVTKSYVDSIASSSAPGSPTNSIQYNNAGSFGGSANLTWSSNTLTVNDITLTTGNIAATTSNGDLTLTANGTGTLYFKKILKLDDQASDPTATSSTNKVYSKTPGNAGSGVYFVNSTASDELVSRSKAILFGLIF